MKRSAVAESVVVPAVAESVEVPVESPGAVGSAVAPEMAEAVVRVLRRRSCCPWRGGGDFVVQVVSKASAVEPRVFGEEVPFWCLPLVRLLSRSPVTT